MKTVRWACLQTATAVMGLAIAALTLPPVARAADPAPAGAPTADSGSGAKSPEQLVQDLKSPSAATFNAAVQGLQGLGAGAVPALAVALKDPNPDVRGRAAALIASIGPAAKDAVPALIEQLGDSNRTVRFIVAATIGELGPAGEPAVPALTKALADPVPEVRKAAAESLGRLGASSRSAVPALLVTAKDANEAIRAISASTLGKIGPGATDAIPVLQELAERDPSAKVKDAATEALARIKAGPAAPPAPAAPAPPAAAPPAKPAAAPKAR